MQVNPCDYFLYCQSHTYPLERVLKKHDGYRLFGANLPSSLLAKAAYISMPEGYFHGHIVCLSQTHCWLESPKTLLNSVAKHCYYQQPLHEILIDIAKQSGLDQFCTLDIAHDIDNTQVNYAAMHNETYANFLSRLGNRFNMAYQIKQCKKHASMHVESRQSIQPAMPLSARIVRYQDAAYPSQLLTPNPGWQSAYAPRSSLWQVYSADDVPYAFGVLQKPCDKPQKSNCFAPNKSQWRMHKGIRLATPFQSICLDKHIKLQTQRGALRLESGSHIHHHAEKMLLKKTLQRLNIQVKATLQWRAEAHCQLRANRQLLLQSDEQNWCTFGASRWQSSKDTLITAREGLQFTARNIKISAQATTTMHAKATVFVNACTHIRLKAGQSEVILSKGLLQITGRQIRLLGHCMR